MDDVQIKMKVESPGLIELITKKKGVILALIKILVILYKLTKKKEVNNRELKMKYDNYDVEELKLDLPNFDFEKEEI